jgi:hypothetical protein
MILAELLLDEDGNPDEDLIGDVPDKLQDILNLGRFGLQNYNLVLVTLEEGDVGFEEIASNSDLSQDNLIAIVESNIDEVPSGSPAFAGSHKGENDKPILFVGYEREFAIPIERAISGEGVNDLRETIKNAMGEE